MKQFHNEAALIIGVIWMWFGHIFTPEHLEELRYCIQWLTTLTVAFVAAIRLYKTVKNPNKIE